MPPARGSSGPSPESAAGGAPLALVLSLLPALALAALTARYIYRDCVAEPDTIHMINGVLAAHADGEQWNPLHKYGFGFTFGYYWLLYQLPKAVLDNPARLIAAVNAIGFASAILACGALGLLARRLHGAWTGLAMTLPLALSPMMLELSTYGHPFLLSVALLLFGAEALLSAETRRGTWAWAGRAVALALVVASLTVRADSLIALPWLVVAGPYRGPADSPARRLAGRGLLLGAAACAFLLLQHAVVGHRASTLESLGSFFAQFYRPGQLVRGIVVGLLAGGLGLAVATAIHGARWARRGFDRAILPPLVLLGTAGLFWLPNPTPCRHLFFAVLAACEIFAVGAARRLGARAAVAWAVAVVLANQVAAELLYRPIAARYPWAYASSTPRRATGAVPIGWFLPNHVTLQAACAGLREEGRRLAAARDPEIVAFADSPYLVLGWLERGDVRLWRDTVEAGFVVTRLERPGQVVRIIEKAPYWPRDVAAEYLAAHPLSRARVYVNPATRSRYDRAPLPDSSRALTLP
jgi:hypothetical protein